MLTKIHSVMNRLKNLSNDCDPPQMVSSILQNA